ncbi:hypothetical protein SLEP1_g40261 [Rubroshorea leprosula]|nr:hypothetical protein SLEP1_g40261 [Rubroshorea leprosula]
MSDPTSLHLKKELTQIRKAARLLRDPGTTSSWKSSSTSVLPPASTSTLFTNHFNAGHHPPPDLELPNAKHSAVFLHNWKHQNHKSNHQFDDDADPDAASSSWVQDDSLSDARNGADSKSDTYIPTLALLPSYSGAAMQILSLQDSCLAPGKRAPPTPGSPPPGLSFLLLLLPPFSSTLFTNHFHAGHHPPPDLELPNAKHSAVFLHNWKHQNHKSNHQFDDDADADAASSSWVQDDSLSDARNGADSKSDTYIPTLALLPSYSGAAMQILSLQDSCLAPGKG